MADRVKLAEAASEALKAVEQFAELSEEALEEVDAERAEISETSSDREFELKACREARARAHQERQLERDVSILAAYTRLDRRLIRLHLPR